MRTSTVTNARRPVKVFILVYGVLLAAAACGPSKLDRDKAKRILVEQRGYPRRVTAELESPFGEQQILWSITKDPRQVGNRAMNRAIEAGLLSLTPIGAPQSGMHAGTHGYQIVLTAAGKQHLVGSRIRNLYPAPSSVMYKFVACDEDLGEVHGIVTDGNRAQVEYSTVPTRQTPLAYLEPAQCETRQQHTAVFERYDDGWRLVDPG